MKRKLENIYEDLKMNPHKYMCIFREIGVIIAFFDKLENTINMLIDMSKYSDDINLIYDSRSKEYRTELHLHDND